MHKKIIYSLIFLVIFFIFPISTIGAQTSDKTDSGLSVSVPDTNTQNGDIVCSGNKGYILCNNEYDSSIYGVVDNNPSTAITLSSLTNPQIVVARGETTLRVTSKNGNIKIGDFLTSSTTPGVAELAVKQGYVVATALESYNSNDKTAVGNIKVSLNIHANNNVASNTRQNLIDLLRSGLSGLGVDPISALRYILAALVVIVSLVTGFIYFGRIAQTGVAAIGRNPLAGGRIEASVVINITIMLIIVGAGLVIAYLILAI